MIAYPGGAAFCRFVINPLLIVISHDRPFAVRLEHMTTAQLPRLKPGEYVKGDLIVSPRLGAQEMGFVLHGICEAISVDTGKTTQTYR